jgi:hypothetical protein
VNKIVDKLMTCLHWFDLFFPGRKDKIDWKHVGEMRARLVKMRFGDKITSANSITVSTEVNGSMMMNFRTMSSDRTKQSLSHWYTKESFAKREKELSERVVSGQRAHEARQTSGAYQAIAEKDAAALYADSGYEEDAIYEVQQQPMTKEAEAKLADFLSGNSDDMNSFLFTNLTTGEETGSLDPLIHEEEVSQETGLASKFRRTRTHESVSQNSEVIAALEEAHKLDSYVREELSETPSSSAPSSVAEETAVNTAEVPNNCSSLADARSRKAATVKSKLLKKLYTV